MIVSLGRNATVFLLKHLVYYWILTTKIAMKTSDRSSVSGYGLINPTLYSFSGICLLLFKKMDNGK